MWPLDDSDAAHKSIDVFEKGFTFTKAIVMDIRLIDICILSWVDYEQVYI